MPAPSLRQLATATAIKHVKSRWSIAKTIFDLKYDHESWLFYSAGWYRKPTICPCSSHVTQSRQPREAGKYYYRQTASYSLSMPLWGLAFINTLYSSETAFNGTPLPTPRRRRPRTMARLHQTRHPSMGNLRSPRNFHPMVRCILWPPRRSPAIPRRRCRETKISHRRHPIRKIPSPTKNHLRTPRKKSQTKHKTSLCLLWSQNGWYKTYIQ